LRIVLRQLAKCKLDVEYRRPDGEMVVLNLYIILWKEDEMGAACNTHGEMRNVYRSLVAKLEGKRPLERPRRFWGNNIKMDHRELVWKGALDSSVSRIVNDGWFL
jgi:hypothetical protein